MEHQNVGLAFGLSVAAGLATGVGGSIVFWSSIVNHFNTLFLAAALSSSAGVMLWVSFCELLIESTDHFKEGGHSDAGAAGAATACFFAGCLMVNILDQIVHGILHYNDAGAMWTSAEGAPGRGWRNLPAWPAFLARQYVASVKDWYQEVKAAANSGSNGSDSARGGHHHRHGHGHSHGHGNRQPSTGDHQPVPSASELATGPAREPAAEAATHAEGDVSVAVRSLAGLRMAANSIGEDASLLVHVGCAPVADTPLTALPVSAGAAASGAGTTAAVGSSPRAGHGPARQGSMAASPTTSTKGANLQRFPSFSDASGSNNNLNYAGNEDGAASMRVDADRERGSGTGSRGDGGRGADATGGAGGSGSGGTIDSSTGYETLDSTRQPGSTRDHRSGSCDALEPAPASLSRHGSAAAAAGTIALPADTPAWVQEMTEIDEHAHLNKLGLLAAVAIAIHNVPEGVATFVGWCALQVVQRLAGRWSVCITRGSTVVGAAAAAFCVLMLPDAWSIPTWQFNVLLLTPPTSISLHSFQHCASHPALNWIYGISICRCAGSGAGWLHPRVRDRPAQHFRGHRGRGAHLFCHTE